MQLTYLEFYSGIGGWTMALEEAVSKINVHQLRQRNDEEGKLQQDPTRELSKSLLLKRLAAFDHSDLCNMVFQHNFSSTSPSVAFDTHTHTVDGVGLGSCSTNGVKMRQKRRRMNTTLAIHHTSTVPIRSTTSKATPIEKLTLTQLQEYHAMIWALSPPCQPFTRQHDNQAQEWTDPRSKSFLHLCTILETMKDEFLPQVIFMENVVGFEKSQCCQRWRQVLMERKYAVGHFHLSPTQVGIPNDRPRYYCVAVFYPFDSPPRLLHQNDGELESKDENEDNMSSVQLLTWVFSCIRRERDESMISSINTTLTAANTPLTHDTLGGETISRLYKPPTIHTNIQPLLKTGEIHPIATYLDEQFSDAITHEQLRIPPSLLHSDTSWCFDIVVPWDKRSSCFTSSYGRFARGTGSVLYTGPLYVDSNSKDEHFLDIFSSTSHKNKSGSSYTPCGTHDSVSIIDKISLHHPEERKFDAKWSYGMNLERDLRYFSGTEVARLMGFPMTSPSITKKSISHRCGSENVERVEGDEIKKFSFPAETTLKQQWKLLGNSLNVKVATSVVEIGLLFFLNVDTINIDK